MDGLSSQANVLVTFAGRKSYVIVPLQASPNAGRIVVADADSRAPVRVHAQCFETVPRLDDEKAYLASLEGLCTKHAIDSILPLNDMDVRALSSHSEQFAALGVQVLGAPEGATHALCDKLQAAEWLRERGFRTPETHTAEDARSDVRTVFPRIAKHRFGQGSRGVHRCDTPEDLVHLSDEYVVQPLLDGTQFNLDVLRSASGDVVSVVPKQKLEMSDGTASLVRSSNDSRLLELGLAVGNAVEHFGSIDVDVIEWHGELYVLEINPRLGGCFPFTNTICPAYTHALMQIAGGASPSPFVGAVRNDVRVFRELQFVEVP